MYFSYIALFVYTLPVPFSQDDVNEIIVVSRAKSIQHIGMGIDTKGTS